MDIKDLTDEIFEVEKHFNVNDWVIDDMQIWPILRYHLLLNFKSEKYAEKVNPLKPVKSTFFSKIKSKIKYNQLVNSTRKKISFRKEHSLFFTNISEHRETIESKKYNRLVDPYITQINNEGRNIVKIVLDTIKNNDLLFNPVIPFEIEDLWYFDLRLYDDSKRIENLMSKIPFSKLEDQLNLKFNKEKIVNDIRTTLMYKRFFLKVLNGLNINAIFYVCYYRSEYFGLTIAANKLGISTIDVQHGKQGTHHPMYSHFGNIPKDGYAVLPTYFWNWGEESVNNILKFRNNTNIHVPICSGNLYTAMFMNNNIDIFLKPGEIEFIEKLKKFEKVILLALQPPVNGKAIPDFVRNSIENSTDDFFWLLRKHPIHEDKEADFLQEKFKNVNTDFASSILLYPLLKHTNITLTRWSTVCYEAEQMGNKIIIIDEIGNKLYKNEIDEGRFLTAKDSQELNNCILSNKETAHFNNFISIANEDIINAICLTYGS